MLHCSLGRGQQIYRRLKEKYFSVCVIFCIQTANHFSITQSDRAEIRRIHIVIIGGIRM